MKLSAYPSAPKSVRRNATISSIIGIVALLIAYYAGFSADSVTALLSSADPEASRPDGSSSLMSSIILAILVGINVRGCPR